MSDANPPELNAQGEAKPAFLIPLWTWLALLTLSIAAFFHGASQGLPWEVAFGAKLTDADKVRGNLAGLWGVPFLSLAMIALCLLSLQWMQRNYAEHKQSVPIWQRLPAPEFWKIPTTDGVARTLRFWTWLLLLLVAPLSFGHLARNHFQLEFFYQCESAIQAGCTVIIGDAPLPGAHDQRTYFRRFAQETGWPRFFDHMSPRHLWAKNYFDHSFHAGKPSHLTYYPGLQPLAYLLLMATVAWLWLRIILSALFGRMVLGAPMQTLRRIALFRLRAPSGSMPMPAPLPPASLRIGVIGHRDLGARAGAVRARLVAVFLAARQPGYKTRIVSGMAAGADRLAVDCALAHIDRKSTLAPAERIADLELLVLLPGLSDRFRDFSAVHDKADFDAQVGRISALGPGGQVKRLVLPGVFDRHADPSLANTHNAKLLTVGVWQQLKPQEELDDAPHRALRIAAHRFKSDVLLRQCEFLIAVMKLSDSGKPGGTRECVEAALALNTPVLVIDIDSDQMALVTRVDQLRPGALPNAIAAEDFAACIKSQLPKLDAAGIPENLGYLARIYRPAKAPWVNRLSPWWGYFEAWFANPSGPAPSAQVLRKPLNAKVNTTLPHPTAVNAPLTLDFGKLRRRIADEQGAIMSGSRGAFVLAYGLGLVAVSLALIIVLQLAFWPPTSKASLTLLITLTLIKFGVVLLISKIIHQLGPHGDHAGELLGNLGNPHASRGATVNDIAVALRYIAERLRIMPVMAKLGCARMDLLHQSQRMGDPARIAEDLCRRITLAEVVQHFDPCDRACSSIGLLRNQVLDGQIEYNQKSSDKWKRIHQRLEGIVQLASRALIWIIVADLMVLALKVCEKLHWLPKFEALTPLGLILVVLTALLPALMATCNALLFQTQCEQRAERERDLAKTFKQQQTATNALAAQIGAGQVGAPVAAAVLVEAERTATVLAEEVAEWAVMSRQQAKEV